MKGRQPTELMRVTEFWMSVDRQGEDECWPWTEYVNEDGYGSFYFEGRMVGAHELAITFTTGEKRLPELDTCHSCGNRICCNPKHLRFDTRLSNVADTVRMGLHTNKRITDEQVRTIRLRHAAGASQRELAQQFEVSASLVNNLITGRKRRDAGGPTRPARKCIRKAS